MPQGQSEGTNLGWQTRLWDSYHRKNPNLRHCQARSQNKGLNRASQLPAGPSSSWDRQPDPEGGSHGPREALSTKLQAGFVANRDFLGVLDGQHLSEKVRQVYTQKTERQGWGRWWVAVTALTKHLITWAARTWEGHKMQAQPSLRLWGLLECLNLSSLDLGGACSPGPASDDSQWSNLEPEQCGQRGHTCCEWGQAQCGWDSASTCQCYLFGVSLPPHSTTEQVSLKESVHHRPPSVRAEIRHWRDQQTEEAKTEGTAWGLTGSTDYIGRGL